MTHRLNILGQTSPLSSRFIFSATCDRSAWYLMAVCLCQVHYSSSDTLIPFLKPPSIWFFLSINISSLRLVGIVAFCSCHCGSCHHWYPWVVWRPEHESNKERGGKRWKILLCDFLSCEFSVLVHCWFISPHVFKYYLLKDLTSYISHLRKSEWKYWEV